MKKNKEKKKISLKDKLFKTIVSNKILSVVIISIVTLLIAGTTTLIIVNRIKLKTIKNTTIEEKTKEVKHTLTLNLKEVSVEEGTEYKITDFIDSILRDDAKLVITEQDGKYLVSEEVIASETTENDANESTDDAVEPKYLEDELVLTYESEDMASITEVGEHTIKIKATLGKATAEAEAKLNITAKPEEEPAQATTNTVVRSNSGSSNSRAQAAQPAQSCTRLKEGIKFVEYTRLYTGWEGTDGDANVQRTNYLWADKDTKNSELFKAIHRWRNYGIRRSLGSDYELVDSCGNMWGRAVLVEIFMYDTFDVDENGNANTSNPYWYSFTHESDGYVGSYWLINEGQGVVWNWNPNNLSWWFTDETRDLGL